MIDVVGLGPGAGGGRTADAQAALAVADVLVGYTAYIALIRTEYPDKPVFDTAMRGERARCEEALRLSEEKYGSRLRGLALRILADAHDAEECENDTYLAAWNSIPPHEPRSYLFAFLARITRHLSLDRCRSRNREKRGGGAVAALTEELLQCLPGGETPEEALDLQTLGERISAFLQAQPAEKRNLFLRRYWYCDSILDIARRYGLSESKVKSSLSRSRKALREQLRKEGYDV